MQHDLMGVLEATYALGGDDSEWMRALLGRVQNLVGRDLSAVGFFVDAGTDDYVEPIQPVVLGLPDGHAERIAQGILASGPVFRGFQQTTPPVGTASSSLGGESWKQILPMLREALTTAGVEDVIGLRSEDPSGRGCVLGATLHETTTLSRRQLHAWQRVCAHFAAALRLRRRVGRTTALLDEADRSSGVEAILSPEGKVEHAEGPARAAAARDVLASAVQDMERARAGRKDPEEALSLWRALVAGRWSLVDTFEHGGRRYVVAHKNAPSTPSKAAALTPREQQVVAYAALGHTNKLIAYELGLATSTVAGHLATASAKMGVASRVELIRRAREDAGSARGA